MKLIIASDIHGSCYYCTKLLSVFKAEQADKLLLLGDILYHGPRNALPAGYDPRFVAMMLNEHKDRILCVRGNCEAEVDQMMLEFPVMADYALFSLDGINLYATHGHLAIPPMRPNDILVSGHTHVPTWENNRFNPGSVSIPKEESHHGYILYADRTFTWKDFDGNVIHTCTL